MSKPTDSAGVAATLRSLRDDVGDIEFGYRAQALFAHVLDRVGGSVVEVNNNGHPDIIAWLDGRLTRVEVEVAQTGERSHVIKADDAEAISPRRQSEQGYLVVLDIAEPVRWAPIEYDRVRSRLGRQPLATLHAIARRDLARACNEAFARMIVADAKRLRALTFSLLRRRVLRGQGDASGG